MLVYLFVQFGRMAHCRAKFVFIHSARTAWHFWEDEHRASGMAFPLAKCSSWQILTFAWILELSFLPYVPQSARVGACPTDVYCQPLHHEPFRQETTCPCRHEVKCWRRSIATRALVVMECYLWCNLVIWWLVMDDDDDHHVRSKTSFQLLVEAKAEIPHHESLVGKEKDLERVVRTKQWVDIDGGPFSCAVQSESLVHLHGWSIPPTELHQTRPRYPTDGGFWRVESLWMIRLWKYLLSFGRLFWCASCEWRQASGCSTQTSKRFHHKF